MIPLNEWSVDDSAAIAYNSFIKIDHIALGRITTATYRDYEFWFEQTKTNGFKKEYLLNGATIKKNAEMIDDVNYRCSILSDGSLILYFILDLSTLTEEYAALFSTYGIFIWCNNESVRSQITNMYSMVFNYGGIDSRYIRGDIQRTTDETLTTEDKTIIGAINEVNTRATTQSDWNQNDASKSDYIKNRICWTDDPIDTIIVEETNITLEDKAASLTALHALDVGQEYIVILDGVSYSTVCKTVGSDGCCIGNSAFTGGEDTGEPFAIACYISDTNLQIYIPDATIIDHTVSILGKTITTHLLDEKYIPDSFKVGRKTTGNVYNIDGEEIVAGVGAEIFNNYVTNPSQVSPLGLMVIEGNIATGDYSHAEGTNTKALGDYSHAEGYNTIATNFSAHAEGSYSTASGIYSHAEGNETVASGDCSHAEGDNTIASGKRQHVQGVYNIEDTENKYAHIVGNGDRSKNTNWQVKKSNAHTLDWDGNAEYQGDVKANACGGENPISLVETASTVNEINNKSPYIIRILEDDYGAGFYLNNYNGVEWVSITPADVLKAYNENRPLYASYYTTPLQLVGSSSGSFIFANDAITDTGINRCTYIIGGTFNNITVKNIGFNIDNKADRSEIPTTLSQLSEDETHRLVTDEEKALWNSANSYTDTKIAGLINSAPTTLDTLGEIANAMEENQDVVSALEMAIGVKADLSDLNTHKDNTTVHITSNERTKWNSAIQTITSGATNGTISVDNVEVAVKGLTSVAYMSLDDIIAAVIAALSNTESNS